MDQAAEAKPGNRAVVHHIIVFFRTAKEKVGEIAATSAERHPAIRR